jgi:uncharacterized protein YgiM (DUF1202 family)
MKDLIGKFLGQYELVEKIGQGGMAHVFKAYQSNLDRFVAIKVLSPILAEEPGFTERFQREARAVARLHHPNILQVYDSGIEDKYNYIVMHYVQQSRTLHHLIKEGAPLEQLFDCITQVAAALNYAHQQGVIHRDVKPSNILIDGQWALLSDFGLVKVTQSSSHLTHTGVGMGTPAYMSPEQASGSAVDHRTDIYALGIILHRILTGTVPHNAKTPMAIMVKRSTEPITPPRQIKPDIPQSLEQVVLRSLAKEPDIRYSTAIEFADALKKASTDSDYREPTLINVPDATVLSSSGARLAERKQPNWGLILGGVGAVVIVLVLLVAGIFFLMNDGRPGTQSTPPAAIVEEGQTGAIVLATDTPVPATQTPTLVKPGTPSVLAKSSVEVRNGPGDEYDLIGFLPEGAEAVITSRDQSTEWWQIQTTLSGDRVGWIKADADLINVADTNNVPIALAPPTPTPNNTSTPPLAPDTPAPTATAASSETPTPTSTATATQVTPTVAPATARPPTATPVPEVPTGQFTLLEPNSLEEPTYGLTEFKWQWGGSVPADQGFEVRAWREGEPPAGVHNAVLDNQNGKVKALGNNTYSLTVDITNAPSVRGRSGDYLWTVLLVQISPDYKELGVQASSPGHLRLAVPGGGGGGGGGSGEGGGGGKPSGGN